MTIPRRRLLEEDQLSRVRQEVKPRWFWTLDVAESGQMESHTT